ncbi:MAG: 4'-phosphopantetheinyl transferase superfamily protein [Lachnospiraceae bacterium]|nr:4'-phosphopantetheinyl transferase superfamily protein [Lachnospiraceae bacterium]
MIKIFAYKLDENNADILLDKMSLLSLKEKEYVCRYKYVKDQLRSLIGRLMLFSFADRYTDECYNEINLISGTDDFTKENISDIIIATDENGKGRIENRKDIFFNISHSKDYVVLALSDKEIGIDIQEIKPLKANVPKRFFTDTDNEYIDEIEEEKIERFTRVWSAKESFAKLTGNGIGEGFATFYEDFEKMVIIDVKTGKEKANLIEYFIDGNYKCFASVYTG